MPQRLFLSLALVIFLHSPVVYADATFQVGGVALAGYDPVSYHRQQRAIRGSSDHSYQWNGATWHFTSEANRDLFAQNPQQYAPQYGGYCAYAASKNQLAPVDPYAWTLRDGRLYLNFSKAVREVWRQDIEHNIELADKNWLILKDF